MALISKHPRINTPPHCQVLSPRLAISLRSTDMKRRRTSTASNPEKRKNERGECSQTEKKMVLHSDRSLTDLPSQILIDILVRLPIKRISICKCVSKRLREIVSDPEFAKRHFEKAEVFPLIRALNSTLLSRILYLFQPEHDQDFDVTCYQFCSDGFCQPNCNHRHVNMKLDTKFKIPLRNFELACNDKDAACVMSNPRKGAKKQHCIKVKPKDQKDNIVNSCNGLLCLSELSWNNPVVVCNPVTGEFINLPEVKMDFSKENKRHVDCGLGFSPVTNQYKVIRMFNHYTRDTETGKEWYDGRVAEVHTLGSGSWRNIGSAPYSLFKLAFPTYLNGALHWFCLDHESSDFIVSFDIEKERLQSFPPPSRQCPLISVDKRYNVTVSMGILGGCLCICDSSDVESIKIWVMKDYGIKNSWTRVFSIDCHCDDRWPFGLYQPIKYMNDGALLMFNYPRSALIYYDPRKLGFKYFKFQGVKSKFEIIAHTPSFISLKDAVMGDNVQVLNVNSRCAGLKLQGESRALCLAEEIRNLEIETESGSSDDGIEKWSKHWWGR